MELEKLGGQAKAAARKLNSISTEVKNKALLQMAGGLRDNQKLILEANAEDMEQAKAKGTTGALLDRLLLNQERIGEMAVALEEIAALDDTVGQIVAEWQRPNGLKIKKVRVPLGVIGVIYEARPNVTVEAAGLCLKSGNAVILRGGSLAIKSNTILVNILQKSASEAGLPENAIQIIEDTSHEIADEFMALKYLDVLIPRGGNQLIEAVVEKAKVPVLWAAAGNCHTYVDKDANLEMALPIVINAKAQRPGVCNAMETLLVHKDIAADFLPKAIKELQEKGVEIRGDEKTLKILQNDQRFLARGVNARNDKMVEATEDDYYTEFLDLILAVKVVDSVEEAINHINKYGTLHSEAIITENPQAAHKFTTDVDAAAVYVNASTRFTDGGQFGLGAEIGISTQKLHVRGPMGLEALTSTKYVIEGTGQIRK